MAGILSSGASIEKLEKVLEQKKMHGQSLNSMTLADLPQILREAKTHCLVYNDILINMSDFSQIFESRYAAFIIWTIFILAFVIVPFVFVPLKFLLVLGRICRQCRSFAISQGLLQGSDEVGSDGPVYSVWDVEYAHLSQRTKNQISEIRAREISKCLAADSLELSAENMITRQHDNDDDGHDEEDQEDCDASSRETPGESNQSRTAPVEI